MVSLKSSRASATQFDDEYAPAGERCDAGEHTHAQTRIPTYNAGEPFESLLRTHAQANIHDWLSPTLLPVTWTVTGTANQYTVLEVAMSRSRCTHPLMRLQTWYQTVRATGIAGGKGLGLDIALDMRL